MSTRPKTTAATRRHTQQALEENGLDAPFFPSLRALSAKLFRTPRSGRPDDGMPSLEEMVGSTHAWRLAEAGLVPFTEEIENGKYDRDPMPFLESLQPGTLPTTGAYCVPDCHKILKDVGEGCYRDGELDRYNLNIVLEMLAKSFAYAIPSADALERIANFSHRRIIEIGAGKGYWAALLSNIGADVMAFDPEPYAGNAWHSSMRDLFGGALEQFNKMWFPVEQGDSTRAANSDDRTLLLIWPPKRPPVASQALQSFTGNQIAYVGEPRALGCADDRFFFELWRDPWSLIGTIEIPRFPWHFDRIYLYTRNSA